VISLGSALTALEANLNTDLERAGAQREILAWEAVMQPLHHLASSCAGAWGVVPPSGGRVQQPELREGHQSPAGGRGAFSQPGRPRAGDYRALEKNCRGRTSKRGPVKAGELDCHRSNGDFSAARSCARYLLSACGASSDGEQNSPSTRAVRNSLTSPSDFFRQPRAFDCLNQRSGTLTLTTADGWRACRPSVLISLAQAADPVTRNGGPRAAGLRQCPRYGPFSENTAVAGDLRASGHNGPWGRASSGEPTTQR